MKRLLLLNQGNTDNYGDLAIYRTIKLYFEQKGYIVDFHPFWDETLVFGKYYFKYPYHLQKILLKTMNRIDLFNRFSTLKIMKNKYDAVIIGGGELLGSHNGFNSSLYIWAQKLKKEEIPLYVLGVSGNINMSEEMLNRNKKALSLAKKVFIRDMTTKKICDEFYNVKCKYSPDVVFAYHKIKKSEDVQYERKNGIVIAPITYCNQLKENLGIENEESYLIYLKNLISKYRTSGEPIIICCTSKEDVSISKKLYHLLKDDFDTKYEGYNDLDTYEKIVKNARFVISARMHALIIGIINGCIVDAIPFKEKLSEFKKTFANKKINVSELSENVLKSLDEISLDIRGDANE